MQDYDFDEWRVLAATDPDAFERRRQRALEAVISAVPKKRQQRMRGLQWRVDMERSLHKNSQASCQKVFSMMWESVYGEDGLLEALNGLPGEGQAIQSVAQPKSRPPAQVLAFQAAD